MRKKRRSMVIVTPGKDVTLYIPTDTPPPVISYLNRLKREGVFSQGVMEILTEHILGRGEPEEARPEAETGGPWDGLRDESTAASVEDPMPAVAVEVSVDSGRETPKPLSPADIIRQAARNAGKLLHDRSED